MSKVIFDMSMSLDGFVAGANRRPDEPLGDGGERLHDWVMGGDEAGTRYLETAGAGSGAVITGRRTYDDSLRWWGADGPTGPERKPVFVVTHESPDERPEASVYTFVTEGIEAALEQARAAADGKSVTVMGGPGIGRQFLAAGLVDEVSVHLVPLLFGDGLRFFDAPGAPHVELEPLEVVQTGAATHLRYRVVSG
jgi:dihydrofolate reductase